MPILILYLGTAESTTVLKSSRSCYGSDVRCSMYKMKCEAPQKILVGIMVYGTKLEAQEQCVYGTADCVKTSIICCSYNEADLFTPFQEYDRVTISKQCNGQEAGSRFAPRLSRHPYSSYVVMNYTCM